MQTKDLKEISKRFIWTDFAGYLVSKVLYFVPKKAKTRKETIKELFELFDNAIQSAIKEREKEIYKKLLDRFPKWIDNPYGEVSVYTTGRRDERKELFNFLSELSKK